jgi:hypothetical protein
VHRGWAQQRGQTAAEYLGVLVVVAAIIGVLATSSIGETLRTWITTTICKIAGDDCGGAAPAAGDTPSAAAPNGAQADPAGIPPSVTARQATELQGLLDGGASPADVATWFAGLQPGEAEALTAAHPELVGNTNGAPIPLRYQANAAQIHAERQRLEAAGEDGKRLDNLRRLDDPSRRFLLFDPAGDGRAAEVFGDITTAKDVAIVVPGVSNDLNNFTGADARRLHDQASGLAADGVATVQWLGYDTPDNVPLGVFGGAADRGGEALSPFVDGIGVQRRDGIHTTVIAHSYGSTTAGRALTNSGLQVDDTILIGSPGVGVDTAAELGPGAGRVWAGLADGDPIRFAPVHGPQPVGDDFGATRFSTEGSNGHNEYYQPGSASLLNLALITTGRGDQVIPR